MDIKFEEALQKLETIVDELEQGSIPLEDSLKKYEQGLTLSKICTDKLQKMEKKIKILRSKKNANISFESFEEEKPKKKKHVTPKKTADTENLLF